MVLLIVLQGSLAKALVFDMWYSVEIAAGPRIFMGMSPDLVNYHVELTFPDSWARLFIRRRLLQMRGSRGLLPCYPKPHLNFTEYNFNHVPPNVRRHIYWTVRRTEILRIVN